MPPRAAAVALSIVTGDGSTRRRVVDVGQTVQVRVVAVVEGNRAAPDGIELRVVRPDGTVPIILQQPDLVRVDATTWQTALCLDVPGDYALAALCRTPTPARASGSLRATAVPGDPAPPAAAGPALTTGRGLVWLTQDGRPLTVQP